MNNAEILIKLKKDIDESKVKKNQLQGKLQSLEEQLKEEFNCTLKEVEEKIKELTSENEENQKELDENIKKIREYL
jgi:gas vesicle protein